MATKTTSRPTGKPAEDTKTKPTATVPATTKPTSTAVTRVAPSVAPSFMADDAGIGLEKIGHQDLEIPRLVLLQGTSEQVKSSDHLRAGWFLHTATDEHFDEGLTVVPVYVDKRYILWNPRDSGGGILARADDGVHWAPANREFEVKLDKRDGGQKVKWKTAATVEESGLAEWGTMNPEDPDSPPAATLMYCVVVAFPDRPDLPPAVLTFQRSSVRVARRLMMKLKSSKAPMFGMRFKLASVEDFNGNDSFFNLNLTGDGFVMDENEYLGYKELNDQFTRVGVQVRDLEGAQSEISSGEDEDTDEAPKGGKRI